MTIERKTPWTPGPYRLDYENGEIKGADAKIVAFLPVRFNGTEVGKATGELLAASDEMAHTLAVIVNATDRELVDEAVHNARALLARIGAAA